MNDVGAVASKAHVSSELTYDEIVRSGPGTLCGRYLRSVWQPVYHSADILPGQAKPLRIMGEGFTVYRGSSGTPHLVARVCPHRGLQLSAGFVEGDAIRCFYHGWKFESSGQCVEQPAEESRFAAKICIKSYPVREYIGLIFAYLGEGDPPEFPRYPEFENFEGLLEVDSYLRECNFFQNLENALDQSHIGFVHGSGAASFGTVLGKSLKAEESDWGLTYSYTRDDGESFILQFGMPNIANLATLPTDPEIGFQESLHWWVPVDDESHVQFSIHRVPITGDAAKRIADRRAARRSEIDLPHQQVADDILRGRINIAEVDVKRCDMVRLQDDVAQIGQKRIADRSLEHRGVGDVGLVAGRRIWRRDLLAFAQGKPHKQWNRPASLRASVWGMNPAPGENDAHAKPVIIDMRPYIEVKMQMEAFGAPIL
jgi:5,5'-dehydrodivanillate O-demethylase oxygenase subunit